MAGKIDDDVKDKIETDLYHGFGGGPTGDMSVLIYDRYIKPLEDEIKILTMRVREKDYAD